MKGSEKSRQSLLAEVMDTNLKRIRENKHLMQSQLAEKADMKLRTLQDYEQGRRDICIASASTVYKLAQALEVKMETIMDVKELVVYEK